MKHSTSHESVFQLSNIIIYYQQLLVTNPIKYSIYGRDKIDDVELIKYKMASQVWSPEKLVPPQTWFHNLDIYIPTIPKPKYALIIINSGGRYNYKNFLPDFNKEMLLDIAKKLILSLFQLIISSIAMFYRMMIINFSMKMINNMILLPVIGRYL